jgi:5-methylcytosine-specific restriction enzyme subunit McrC
LSHVTVREYARLTTAAVAPGLECAQVSQSAFDWLCEKQATFRKSGASLVQLGGKNSLVLDQWVGLLRTPCGTTIEVLPKHTEVGDNIPKLRRLLVRMVDAALDLKAREVSPADLHLFNYPISEWVIRQFLDCLEDLIRKGVRFEYRRVEEESRFIRGQIDLARQLRQSPGRLHLVHIRHDVYSPDRPENRLLRSALAEARKITREATNWRRASELSEYLSPIPLSSNYELDFTQWSTDRLMHGYSKIKPWCRLILGRLNPTTVAGESTGLSLLFPMDRLFESYVLRILRAGLSPGTKLIRHAKRYALCTHLGAAWFQLEPDFLVEQDAIPTVLDAKWKRIDSTKASPEGKYDLVQGDFYQLFAYGQRYLQDKGHLFLLYPKSARFQQPLAPFQFSPTLQLWVIPVDLEMRTLVPGDWESHASWWRGHEDLMVRAEPVWAGRTERAQPGQASFQPGQRHA